MTSPQTIIEIPTNSLVAILHENSKNRRGMSGIFDDQDKEFENQNLTSLEFFSLIRNPSLDKDVSKKNLFVMD